MHGFHTHKQFPQVSLIGQQSTAVTVTCIAVCLSLCLTSGCAVTRNAWFGLPNATGNEPKSRCGCTCGECAADAHGEHEAGHHAAPTDPSPAASQTYPATQSPPEGPRPTDHGMRPQAATMNGMPGFWTPSQPARHSEFEDQNSAYVNHPTAEWPEAESTTTNPRSMRYYPRSEAQAQWPPLQAEPAYAPEAASENSELQEYRTQVQILSEQILQMKNAQDSLKLTQNSMQQLHEREVLELKLQQTTGDRDRLQREHELEQQLQKQQQRELESIDSLSEFINGVVSAPAVPNAVRGQVPRSKTQSGQGGPVPSQEIPPMDESL